VSIDLSRASDVYKDTASDILAARAVGVIWGQLFGRINNPGSMDAATLAARIEQVNTRVTDSINKRFIRGLDLTVSTTTVTVSAGAAVIPQQALPWKYRRQLRQISGRPQRQPGITFTCIQTMERLRLKSPPQCQHHMLIRRIQRQVIRHADISAVSVSMHRTACAGLTRLMEGLFCRVMVLRQPRISRRNSDTEDGCRRQFT
jgi:hypothetical protein